MYSPTTTCKYVHLMQKLILDIWNVRKIKNIYCVEVDLYHKTYITGCLWISNLRLFYFECLCDEPWFFSTDIRLEARRRKKNLTYSSNRRRIQRGPIYEYAISRRGNLAKFWELSTLVILQNFEDYQHMQYKLILKVDRSKIEYSIKQSTKGVKCCSIKYRMSYWVQTRSRNLT